MREEKRRKRQYIRLGRGIGGGGRVKFLEGFGSVLSHSPRDQEHGSVKNAHMNTSNDAHITTHAHNHRIIKKKKVRTREIDNEKKNKTLNKNTEVPPDLSSFPSSPLLSLLSTSHPGNRRAGAPRLTSPGGGRTPSSVIKSN